MKIENIFLENGYVICDVENFSSLEKIRDFVNQKLIKNLNLLKNRKINLDKFHKIIKIKDLNQNRLLLINQLNSFRKIKDIYYSLAKNCIHKIVGNELAIQNNINLSIQFPKDDSSLLPLHSDTWSGDSPFEVVLWVPLVNCYKTKSMFILNQKKIKKFDKIYKEKTSIKSSDLNKKIKNDLEFIDIKFGQFILFNQNLPHGNVVNSTNETRWSMNCRFKSLFSPYSEKKFGQFFSPLDIKPATQNGLKYKFPDES